MVKEIFVSCLLYIGLPALPPVQHLLPLYAEGSDQNQVAESEAVESQFDFLFCDLPVV